MMKTLIYRNDAFPITELVKRDPILSELFQAPEEVKVHLMEDYFVALLSAIVSQQLSGKVADVIYRRVETLFDGQITPEKLRDCPIEALRNCGLSLRKVEYVKSLANKVLNKEVDFSNIQLLSNQQTKEMLTQIKGIGPWTAEMFLMFSLGRENVFSVLDLGLRTGMQKLYQRQMTHQEMLEISQKWEPYQSVVSHYLWRYNATH